MVLSGHLGPDDRLAIETASSEIKWTDVLATLFSSSRNTPAIDHFSSKGAIEHYFCAVGKLKEEGSRPSTEQSSAAYFGGDQLGWRHQRLENGRMTDHRVKSN
jgi:hypothetical protein